MKCPNCGFFYDTKKKANTNAQRAYFHGVLVPIISSYTGYTSEEVKDMLKSMFLKHTLCINTNNGVKEIDTVRSTASLSTLEYSKFLNDIWIWASCELGMSIPEPNQKG